MPYSKNLLHPSIRLFRHLQSLLHRRTPRFNMRDPSLCTTVDWLSLPDSIDQTFFLQLPFSRREVSVEKESIFHFISLQNKRFTEFQILTRLSHHVGPCTNRFSQLDLRYINGSKCSQWRFIFIFPLFPIIHYDGFCHTVRQRLP